VRGVVRSGRLTATSLNDGLGGQGVREASRTSAELAGSGLVVDGLLVARRCTALGYLQDRDQGPPLLRTAVRALHRDPTTFPGPSCAASTGATERSGSADSIWREGLPTSSLLASWAGGGQGRRIAGPITRTAQRSACSAPGAATAGTRRTVPATALRC